MKTLVTVALDMVVFLSGLSRGEGCNRGAR
jgi:hypothetical protein